MQGGWYCGVQVACSMSLKDRYGQKFYSLLVLVVV